jgi:hypothetical protein
MPLISQLLSPQPIVAAITAPQSLRGVEHAEDTTGSVLTPESGRLFLGANRAILLEPTGEANGCDLGHVTPKTLQKALYVEFLV